MISTFDFFVRFLHVFLDWCEQNYVVTYYVAEFWNTLSSLLIAFWAIIGIVICIRRGLEKR